MNEKKAERSGHGNGLTLEAHKKEVERKGKGG